MAAPMPHENKVNQHCRMLPASDLKAHSHQPLTRTQFAAGKRQNQDFQDLGIIKMGTIP